MKKITLTLLLGFCALSACAKPQEPRSYDFFKSHPEERADVIRKCRHGDGDVQYQPQAECPAATNAQSSIDREHDQRAFEKR